MKTELKDRTLWFDGTSQVNPELVPELLLRGVQPQFIIVDGVNDDVAQFNVLADGASSQPLEFGKLKNRPFDMSWKIPAKYKNMDLTREINEEFLNFVTVNNRLTVEERAKYRQRLDAELQEIAVRGMTSLIKTLIYVIDKLRESNTVWGVGRGSSCASLVLFLIGLHNVDPIKYGISINEFFHD